MRSWIILLGLPLAVCGQSAALDSLILAGMAAVEAGDYERARAAFYPVYEHRNALNSAQAYNLALGYDILNAPERVAAVLERIMATDSAAAEHYQLYGQALQQQGNAPDAAAVFAEGLELFPNSGRLLREVGLVFNRAGDATTAAKFWRTGVRRAPGYAPNHLHLCRYYGAEREYLWAWLHGEQYFNLTPASVQTREAARIAFSSLQNALVFTSDTTFRIDFRSEAGLAADTSFSLPLAIQANLGAALRVLRPRHRAGPLTVEEWTRVLPAFVEIWDRQGRFHAETPALITLWRDLDRAGLLSDYLWAAYGHLEPRHRQVFHHRQPETAKLLGEFYSTHPFVVQPNTCLVKD